MKTELIVAVVALFATIILGLWRIVRIDTTSRKDRQIEMRERVGRMGGGPERYVNEEHDLIVRDIQIEKQTKLRYQIWYFLSGRFRGTTVLRVKIDADEMIELDELERHPWIAENKLTLLNPAVKNCELRVIFPTADVRSVRIGIDALGQVVDDVLMSEEIENLDVGDPPPGTPQKKKY
jgi:hypothetical protein